LPINVAVTADAGIAMTTGPFDDTTSSLMVSPEGTASGRLGAVGDEVVTWGFDPQVGAGMSVGPAGKYGYVQVGPTGHMLTLGDGALIAGAGDNGWSFALGRGDVVGMRVTPTEGVYFELGGGMFNLLLRPDGHVEMLPLRTAGTAAGGAAVALAGLREAGPVGSAGSAARSAAPVAQPGVIPGTDASKATKLPARVVGSRAGAPAAGVIAPRAANARGGNSGANLRSANANAGSGSGNALIDSLYSGDPSKAQLQARLDRVGSVLRGLVGTVAGGAAKVAEGAAALPVGGAGAKQQGGTGASGARVAGVGSAVGGLGSALLRGGRGGPVFLPAPSSSAAQRRQAAAGGSGLRVPSGAKEQEAAVSAAPAVAPTPTAPPPPPPPPTLCPGGQAARVSADGRAVCRVQRERQGQQQRQRRPGAYSDDDDNGLVRQRRPTYGNDDDNDGPGWRREQQQQQRGRQWRDDNAAAGDDDGDSGSGAAARRRGGGGASSSSRQQEEEEEPKYETVSYYG
jgi:hypothetical protein